MAYNFLRIFFAFCLKWNPKVPTAVPQETGNCNWRKCSRGFCSVVTCPICAWEQERQLTWCEMAPCGSALNILPLCPYSEIQDPIRAILPYKCCILKSLLPLSFYNSCPCLYIKVINYEKNGNEMWLPRKSRVCRWWFFLSISCNCFSCRHHSGKKWYKVLFQNYAC